VTPDPASILLGVVVERRAGVTAWAEHVWRAVEVLPEPLPAAPWTKLREDAARALFYAGEAELWLHRTDTPNLKHNLEAETPLVWVVLRPAGTPPGMALQRVTADGGEAHLYADTGGDTVEALPMPPCLRDAVAAYVARHHVEHAFFKRKREAADPEALGRRPGGRRFEEEEEG
jgi:hypothetical protein